MPRVYERKFDWDEACRRVQAGESVRSVARDLGVSPAAIYRVTNAERYETDRQRVAAFQASGTCPDCGAQTSRRPNRTSARCRRCASIRIATTVREGELQCVTCKQWKPDREFSPRNQPTRRNRHRQCRVCNTAAKRDYRRRNPGRG